MKDFIFIPGMAINPAMISHVKYNKNGSVVVVIGADAIAVDAEHAKVFFDAAPKATPAVVQTAAQKKAAADTAAATAETVAAQ